MQQHAKRCRGQERDEQADREPPRVFVVRDGLRHLPKLLKIDHANRQDRAELNEDFEHLARRCLQPQQALDQNHVPGRRNRKKLGNPLNQRENDGGYDFPQQFHGTPSGIG